MPSDIQRQLALVRLQCRKTPMTSEAEAEVVQAFKREVMQQRAIIIKALAEVSAFGPLDLPTLENMADGTSERFVPAGEVVAAQDALATEFYIVVSGVIRVSRRAVLAEGPAGQDQEVNRLHAGSNFGAGELLAGEQYSTTYEAAGAVTLAVMSANEFHAWTDRAIVNKSHLTGGQPGVSPRERAGSGDVEEDRVRRGSTGGGGISGARDGVAKVVNRVPIFAPLSLEQKGLVSNALLEVHFRPGLYICEEGKPGSSFHIITSGTCRVTIHDPNAPGQRREVTKLHQDDFFGEVALIDSGLRTATVVAETDVTCLSLTRRHFDLYLKPIKTAILESAAAKALQALQLGEDELDELDDDFELKSERHPSKEEGGTEDGGSDGKRARGGRGGKGGGEKEGGEGGAESAGARDGSRSFRNPRKGARRRKQASTFRGVATHALRVQRRNRVNFYDRFSDDMATSLSPAKAMRRASRRLSGAGLFGRLRDAKGGNSGSGRSVLEEAASMDSGGFKRCRATLVVRALARLIVLALENDMYATLLDEMIDRPTGLPECNKIVSKVLYEDLRRWGVAYDLIRGTARRALAKVSTRLKDGELAVLSGLFRIHPLLRQRYCTDWPEYHWAELCKSMRLEEVRSLDKVYVHEAHGTRCYTLLRGLARVLMPEEDPDRPGTVRYRPHADLGPGDLFGDDVLEGGTVPKKRSGTVVAVTDCEFAVLEQQDYAMVRDRGLSQMSLDDKSQFLKSCALMRVISTYRRYNLALLAITDEAAKDSVILWPGEPSKALYFIVSGTVEVIQLKKKMIDNNIVANAGAGSATGNTKGSGIGGGSGAGGGPGVGGKPGKGTGDSPRDGQGGAELVLKTARKVLTVLESGEYFGESGVLTFFNGGNKASSTAAPVTEKFCLVARTNVEMLVIRRKHFNIIDLPMLEIMKANHAARLKWRARRKQEAHRGRVALRAAKKALDQAAVRAGGVGGNSSLVRLRQHQAPLAATGNYPRPSDDGSGDGNSMALLAQRKGGAGGGPRPADTFGRPPRPHGAGGGNVDAGKKWALGTAYPGGAAVFHVFGVDGDGGGGGGGGDDMSLAGLSLTSGDSMQYSVDSGWLPSVRGTDWLPPTALRGGVLLTGYPPGYLDDDSHQQHQQYRYEPQDHEQRGRNPGAAGDDRPSEVSLRGSISLPDLGPAKGLADDGLDGRRQTHRGIRGGRKPGPYVGHKQPGLHGSKSFGAFWEVGAKPAADDHRFSSRPPLIHSNRLENGAELVNNRPIAAAADGQYPPLSCATTATSRQNAASLKAAAGARSRVGPPKAAGGRGLSASDMEVVPAVKGAVELTPIRGISRICNN